MSVNDSPFPSATPTNNAFSESLGLIVQGSAVVVFPDFSASASASEADQTILGLGISISGLRDGSSEILSIDGTTISLGSNSAGITSAHGLAYTVCLSGSSATMSFSRTSGLSSRNAASLLKGLTYQNTDLDNPTGGERSISVTILWDSGGTANGGTANGGIDTSNPNLVSTINVLPLNAGPTLRTPDTITLTDTPGADGFSASTGSLAGSDPEGSALSYGLEGASAVTSSFEGVNYDLSKAGAYGTLYLNSSTGHYRFQPAGDFALNAISASGSESFVFTSSDGSLTSSTPLLLSFSAADDTPVQYVVVNDGLPVLSAAAASLWDQALTQASAYLAELLTRADRDTLLNDVFGRAGTEATVFEANKQALLEAIGTTGLRIAIDLRSGTEMEGAYGAYAQVGPNGHEIIYINADWINAGNLSLEQLTAVVLEEYGHVLDTRLNPGQESAGDEGELFANLLLGDELSAEERAAIEAEDDSATLTIDGVQVAVEQAVSTVAINTTATTTLNKTAGTLSYTVSVDNFNNNGADLLVAAYDSSGGLIGWQVVNRSNELRNTSYNGSFGFNATGLSSVDTTSITLRAWQGTAAAGGNYGTGNDTTPVITYGIGNLAVGTSTGFTVNSNTAPTASNGAISFTGTVTANSRVSTSSPSGVDTIAPTVTDTAISITSTGSGTSGAYKRGDTITVRWDTSATGNNHTDTIASATATVFGTGVTLTNLAGIWTGSIAVNSLAATDTTSTSSVSVTATDNAGNTTTTSDSTSITLDNIAPAVTDSAISITSTGSGTSGAYKRGDTITVRWDNSATGNTNT
ncbi:MAG: hypothetical protein WAM11_16235, partial [Cyanobium sp.]